MINVEDCCEKPAIVFSKDTDRMEMKMQCENCNEFYIVIAGMPIIDYWNKMIIERNRKKREVCEVDIKLYPYSFAMV